MRTTQDLITYCMTFPNVYKDHPFDEQSTVMRHTENQKIWAVFYNHEQGNGYITVKNKPVDIEFYRDFYQDDVTPAPYFHKNHWNKVNVNGAVRWEEVMDIIQKSFDLTKPKVRGK